MVNISAEVVKDTNSSLKGEIEMILKQHEGIMVEKPGKESIIVKQHDQDRVMMQEHAKDRNSSGSLRRRKNGAFARPNLIDVVGQPKHKNSVLNDCLLDEAYEHKLQINSDQVVPRSTSCQENHSMHKFLASKDAGLVSAESNIDYTVELNTLISNLRLADPEQKIEIRNDGEHTEATTVNSSRKIDFHPRTFSERDTDKCASVNDDKFDLHHSTRRHGMSLTEKRSPQEECKFKRSCSLPATRECKSRLPAVLASLNHRSRNQKINSHVSQSSDGEGSAQSMMSFESNASSHEKRSRSGSLLSRLSRSSASPMSDKRSRSGSLQRNRTGCPQYFIPGENRGRVYMPSIDLFETSSLCIKGIKFRIRRRMPRTHRAVSMIGCMGFIVPGPSTYFER